MAPTNPFRLLISTPTPQDAKSPQQQAEDAAKSSQQQEEDAQSEPNPPTHPSKKSSPTPIEQSATSSQQRTENPPSERPRRFAPEPIEHSVKSSKDARPESEGSEDKQKEINSAPVPVESSVRSSKDVKSGQEGASKARRFIPEMVEETRKSSKDRKEEKGQVRFKPEPIATTYGTNRKSMLLEDTANGARKFTPILLDTAKRSRRAADKEPALAQTDKTEAGFHLHARELRRHITGVVTPAPGSANGSEDGDSQSDYAGSQDADTSGRRRRSMSPLDGSPGARAACLMPQHRHSYQLPDLDTIESSESEPSPRSLSPNPKGLATGTPITASASADSLEFYKHATRARESVDETFSQYLLEVERKKAQRRLEEQALAAYPNPDFGYEPPTHYGIDEDDNSEENEIEDRPVTWAGHEDDLIEMARRESTTKGNWDQLEMRRHAEDSEQERNANKITAKKPTDHSSPWWNPASTLQRTEEAEQALKDLRERARPPMLGGDLTFPRCPSPEPARFDVTQGPAALRNQMSYQAEQSETTRSGSDDEGGLWHGVNLNTAVQRHDSDRSIPTPRATLLAKGLWGGFCHDDGSHTSPGSLAIPFQPSGLMTPAPETDTANPGNPFEQSFATLRGGPPHALTTPPPTNPAPPDPHNIDAVLLAERDLDALLAAEFPDTFITQVYNYLSLGYPTLARPFDSELAKISRFSVAELREDDVKARKSPRGYIRLGPDWQGRGEEGDVTEEGCVRWLALRLYVHEWARQEKGMAWTDAPGGNWGTGARRGSWGG